jgi:hypothetical protein
MRIVLDIGGGLARDTEEYALSNIPLRWTMREIVKARCHIHFDKTALELWNIPCETIVQVRMTREPSDSTVWGRNRLRAMERDTGQRYRFDRGGSERERKHSPAYKRTAADRAGTYPRQFGRGGCSTRDE